MLNIEFWARPTLVGDIAAAPFKSRCFDEVFFERVPFMAFTGDNATALEETARILKLGGRLIIETGVVAPVAEIASRLESHGFALATLHHGALCRITAVLRAG